MRCLFPPALSDEQLLASLDGEADPSTLNHLERCTYCREQADRLARWQRRLAGHLYRVVCPPPIELGEYHLGVLNADRASGVARHMRECVHCSRELDQLRGYLRELSPEIEIGPLERARVMIARLVTGAQNAGLTPAFAGVRGEQGGSHVYQVEDAQIALEVQDDVEQQGQRVLLGLVVGLEASLLSVTVWQSERLIATASIDEAGNFAVPHLTAGAYTLILSGPGVDVHIPALEV